MVIWNLHLSQIKLLKQLIYLNTPLRQSPHLTRGVRGHTQQQVVESCWRTLWWRWRWRIGSCVHLVLDQPLSPLGLPAIAPCQAVCRSGTAVWLGAEVARLSREVRSREQSQQTTSTYWARKQLQLWSFSVGRRGSQAVCEAVWSGSLAVCSHIYMYVLVYSPAHSEANITPRMSSHF